MDPILSYIASHWIEWLFTLCIAVLAFAWRSVVKHLKAEQARSDAIAEGVQSLLRESIVQNYNRYHDKGFCPIYAKESIKRVYKAYHDLDGNDVATGLYRELLEMPPEREAGGEQWHREERTG